MNFKQFPLIHEVLVEEGLKPIDVLGGNKLVCSDTFGSKFVLKECRGMEENIFTNVFPKIQKSAHAFEILELPKHKKVIKKVVGKDNNQQEFKYILINYYEGKFYNKSWNEYYPDSLGGRGVGDDLAIKSVGLVKDFSLINVESLSELGLLEFDFERWKAKNFPLMEKGLLEKKVLSEKQIERIENILTVEGLFSKSKKILTNGDFYPRNFIELENGKVVVIDWEGRVDYERDIQVEGVPETFQGQRNVFINYIENHVAFLFVHMWGNYSFRRKLLKKAAETFALSTSDLQVALIIKAMEQSFLWKDIAATHLTIDQAQILVNSLDIQYVKDMVS